MKKHSFLKFVLSLFILSLFFFSCEQEESVQLETAVELKGSDIVAESEVKKTIVSYFL